MVNSAVRKRQFFEFIRVVKKVHFSVVISVVKRGSIG